MLLTDHQLTRHSLAHRFSTRSLLNTSERRTSSPPLATTPPPTPPTITELESALAEAEAKAETIRQQLAQARQPK